MRDVGLIEAWQLWLSGNPTTGISVWSVPMLWWARIGKLMQFAGALTVVLDLVDPDRLRVWGKRMRDTPFRGDVKGWAADSALMEGIALLLTIGLVVWGESVFRAQLAWVDHNVLGSPARLPDWVVWLAIGFVVVLAVFVKKVPDGQGLAVVRLLRQLAVGLLWVAVATLALLLVLAFLRAVGPPAIGFGTVLGLWWLLLWFLDHGFARPVAWLLHRRLPGQPLRWLGVALLVVGFHFDLLAS